MREHTCCVADRIRKAASSTYEWRTGGVNRFGTQAFRWDAACACPATIPEAVAYGGTLNSHVAMYDCRTVMCQPQTLVGTMYQFDSSTPVFSNAYVDGCAA